MDDTNEFHQWCHEQNMEMVHIQKGRSVVFHMAQGALGK
ncbi:MAG: hypothetical protein ACI9DJ_000914 [Algoriphagus sp.]|jgi:hypothetical protein